MDIQVMTHAQFAEAKVEAEKLGKQHGEAAGSWFFDGNTSEATYRRVWRGMEDGDPEIMDSLPSNPLSGEFADGLTPAGLLREIGWNEESVSAQEQDDLCDAYCDAFNEACQDVIGITAVNNLPESNYGAF